MWPEMVEIERQIDAIMTRVDKAGDDHAERVAALEEYIRVARAHDAVRTIRDATRWGCTDGADMLCELAEKLMRSGREPQARPLWEKARASFPADVWVYVQAGSPTTCRYESRSTREPYETRH